MNLANALHDFTDDPEVIGIAILIALDFIFGVSASLVAHTFRFGWLSDFLRKDILMKLVPYFAIWWALHIGGDLEIGNFETLETLIGAAVIASLLASIFNSLRDLGFKGLPDVIAGSDNPPPQP